jgi:hypothetical protein
MAKTSPNVKKRACISCDYVSPKTMTKSPLRKVENPSPNALQISSMKEENAEMRSSTNLSYAQIHSKSPIRSRRTPTFSSSARRRNSKLASKRKTQSSVRPTIRSAEFPVISQQKENTARIWLRSLNLTVLTAQEFDNLLQDPYRNGLLLCEVFPLQ